MRSRLIHSRGENMTAKRLLALAPALSLAVIFGQANNCNNQQLTDESLSAQSNNEAKGICGDGIRQVNETCDGADLSQATCANLGHAGGNLSCQTSCQGFNETGCIPGLSQALAGQSANQNPTATANLPSRGTDYIRPFYPSGSPQQAQQSSDFIRPFYPSGSQYQQQDSSAYIRPYSPTNGLPNGGQIPNRPFNDPNGAQNVQGPAGQYIPGQPGAAYGQESYPFGFGSPALGPVGAGPSPEGSNVFFYPYVQNPRIPSYEVPYTVYRHNSNRVEYEGARQNFINGPYPYYPY